MFLYGFSSCTCFYEWLSILLWVFIMYIFVRMTINIILVWFFVMYISVRMTIHILMGFRHVHVCTNDYPFPCGWVFVMHISAQMTTISFWMGFCHVNFCMNDYHFFLSGFSSCTFMYKWLPFHFEWVFVVHISVGMNTISFWMDFRHAHFYTNDYHFFLNWFLSCTFLYKWLPLLFEWIFVMHISVQMTTISFWMHFHHAHFCANEFPYALYMGFVMHISVQMTFHILLGFPCVQCYSTRD